MTYERERAMHEQSCTEDMIRMRDPIPVPARAPTAAEILREHGQQSFANGFELARQRAVNYLIERADWLRREYQNGGDFQYLHLKEEDCRYTASVIAEMQPPPNLVGK